MDEKTAEKYYCWHCGRELTDRNSWMPTDGYEKGKPTYLCVGCQNSYWVTLARVVGSDLAYFYCCVKFDAPYVPRAIKASYKYKAERGAWGGYITALRAAKYHTRDDKWHGFADGETNIKKAVADLKDLGAESPEEEMERKEKDAAWNLDTWGKGPKGKAYTEADYDTLNAVYDAMSEGRYVSAQSDLAIKAIAKWTLERDKLIAEKDFANAQKLSSMIEKEKESEQLRKKDELPQDRTRLDDIVKAVERAGLHMMDYDELVKELATYMFHTPYGYTRDAADQMLLYMRNATAWNENVPEVDRLEEEFAIIDTLGEFAPEMDDREIETYKELGITPLHMGADRHG